jgi:hypothetical protein
LKIKTTKIRTYTGTVTNVRKKIKLKGGDEYDVHTAWRKLIAAPKSMIKRAKKSYNKRFRKEGKRETKEIE